MAVINVAVHKERDVAPNHSMALPSGLRGVIAEMNSSGAADDQKWIVNLLQRHGAGVIQVLWRMFGREQDVLDAYQTVVCQLVSRGASRSGDNPAAYLYRAAINTGIELIRRRTRERDRWPRVVANRNDCSEREHESPVDRERMVERVRQAVMELPSHLRDVIVLHDFSGMNYARVSSILKITSGTARVYRRQAVVRLTAMFAREKCNESKGLSRSVETPATWLQGDPDGRSSAACGAVRVPAFA